MKLKQISIQTINNHTQTTCVELSLNIIIDKVPIEHTFIVTNEMRTEEMILGIDFIRLYKVDIFGENSQITIKQPNGHRITCQVNTQTVIAAQSEFFLDVLVSNTAYVNKTVVFEPFDYSTKGLVFAHSVDEVSDDKKINIIALNYSEYDVTLVRGDVVGSVQRVCDNSVSTEIPEEIVEVNANETTIHLTDNKTFTGSLNDHSKLDDQIETIELVDDLDATQKQHLKELLKKYSSIFVWSSNDYGRTQLVKHRINTGNANPIKSQPYRVPVIMHNEKNRQIDKMLQNDVIEPSFSPWSSPVTLQRKKDNSYRFCVDFRRVTSSH